jgi:hypothetical protein
MSGIFAITAASNSAKLDSNRQAEVIFTVSNVENRPILGRVHLLPEGNTEKGWLSVAGDTEQYFAIAGTQQFTVRIKAPPGTPAGSYIFRLNMVGVQNPDEDYAEGPAVSIAVPEPVKQQRPFPWWILLIVAALIIIGGLAIFFLNRDNQTAEPDIDNQEIIHQVGEAVKVGDLVIVLTSAELRNSFLQVSFTIENQSASNVFISDAANFEATAADGTPLLQAPFGCIFLRFNGQVAPGEDINGGICYRPGAGGPFKIFFRSEQAGNELVIWQVE